MSMVIRMKAPSGSTNCQLEVTPCVARICSIWLKSRSGRRLPAGAAGRARSNWMSIGSNDSRGEGTGKNFTATRSRSCASGWPAARRPATRAQAANARTLSRSRLPGVADGQRFPHVPVGLAPAHDAAAVVRVDPHVHRTVRGAPVPEVARLDPRHDPVELGLAHPEAIVLDGKGAVVLVEVEGQAVVHVDQAEGAYAGFRPGHAEEVGEQLGRGLPVAGRNDRVVELDAHRSGIRVSARAPCPGRCR